MNKNISIFIKNQFPKYILESDSLFPDFVEAYYEWTNQDNNFQDVTYSLENLQNIDESYNKFVEQFEEEYLKNFPTGLLADKVTLIKKINELYLAKGTPKSAKFLIRILYNIDSDIFLPYTQVIRPSSATWVRDVSVRFTLRSGMIDSFDSTQCIIKTASGEYDLVISRIERVENTSNVFEAFFDINFKLTITSGGTIETSSFTGSLVKTVATKRILKAGIGFDVGELYEISNVNGSNTLIKVTKITENRGLAGFQFIRFGHGYSTNFIKDIKADSLLTSDINNNFTFSGSKSYSTVTDDEINNVNETLTFVGFDYTDTPFYFLDNTYVGSILAEASQNTTTVSNADTSLAVVEFKLGYVLEYPGYYSTNVGFLDDAAYIHDGEYYQKFSYLVKAEENFKNYEETLLNLVHPAGFKLFGEQTLNSVLNINIDVRNRLNNLNILLNDFATTSDEITSKILIRSILEQFQAIDVLSKSLERTLEEEIATVNDSISSSIQKPILEDITSTDELSKSFDRLLADFYSVEDAFEIMYDKVLSEATVTKTDGILVNEGYYEFGEANNYSVYWEPEYAESERRLKEIQYLDVDLLGNSLLININNDKLLVS